MQGDQFDLLAWRGNETTSGPRPAAADGTPVKATSRDRWNAWDALHAEIVPDVLAEARRIVDVALAAGLKPRISAKALVEWIRAKYLVEFNNSATAGLGEWLSEHEDLRPFVERRGKAAP